MDTQKQSRSPEKHNSLYTGYRRCQLNTPTIAVVYIVNHFVDNYNSLNMSAVTFFKCKEL